MLPFCSPGHSATNWIEAEHRAAEADAKALGAPNGNAAAPVKAVVLQTPHLDGQPWALVVDDDPVDRRVIGAIIARATGLGVQSASDGAEALKLMKSATPAVVVTDLQMPNMDGLELVENIAMKHALVPVILMTSQGSEEIAIEALRRGAVSYVPKRNMKSLEDILPQVLSKAKIDRRRQELYQFVGHVVYDFALENDPVLVPLLVAHFQDHVFGMKLCKPNEKIRIGVALEEALLNGLYHGNLEVSSDLKQDGSNAFNQLAEDRQHQAPFRDRKLHVHVTLNSEEAIFSIRDEGPGFDVSRLPDPTDPENLLKASGRGLLLIRTFMDEVAHSSDGNQITMVKRRRPS